METKRINYTITFLSDWHAGSGLSSGADSDAVVIKDKSNLPYLPGKTIKGLLKDVFEDFKEVQPDFLQLGFIQNYFGHENKETKKTDMGSLYFSNAELSDSEKREISPEMTEFLYRNMASTQIDKNGVAKNTSLRTMEVCIPVVLHGHIEGIEVKDIPVFVQAFKYLRHIGANRNRGLGHCKIEIKNP